MLLNDLYFIDQQQTAESEALFSVSIHKSHSIFEGHFPGQPILPGVCQMEICHELINKTLERNTKLIQASSVKFLSFIDPNKNSSFDIKLNWTKDNDQVNVDALIYSNDLIFLKLKAQYIFA